MMPDSQERPAEARAGKTRDARGRTVTQLNPVQMHLLHQNREIPAEPLKAIADEIGTRITLAARLCLWSSLLGFICFVIAIIISVVRLRSGSIGWGIVARNLIPYGCIWVAPFAFWINTRSVQSKRINSVMLKHLRCPHCGYDLRGLPRENPDLATLCPECGCAWLLEADGTTEEREM